MDQYIVFLSQHILTIFMNFSTYFIITKIINS